MDGKPKQTSVSETVICGNNHMVYYVDTVGDSEIRCGACAREASVTSDDRTSRVLNDRRSGPCLVLHTYIHTGWVPI